MKYTLQQPGRSIYINWNNRWKIFKFSIAGSSRAGQRTRFFFVFFFFFGEKMVQSAAIKQGRSANRKHTFFLALADPTIYRPKIKFLIYSTQAAVLRYHTTIFNNDSGLRQTANLQCAWPDFRKSQSESLLLRKQQTKIENNFENLPCGPENL